MPYFVKVGYERKNLSKITSKGYFIKRTGKKVYTEWGAIDAVGLKRKKFNWHTTPQIWEYKCRSEKEALQFKNDKIAYLHKRGYSKLPSSTRIYSRRSK